MSIRHAKYAIWALLAATTAGKLAGQAVTITASNPTGAYAGQTVQLTVSGLAATVTSVSVTITPPAGNGSPVTFLSANIHPAPVPPSRIVQFVVPASLATSSNIPNCQVSISQASGTPFTSNNFAFTLLGSPVVSVVSPGAGILGSAVTVEIVGSNTNFSTASIPSISGSDGATIKPGGTCASPNNATHLCAIVTIPAGAVIGPRNITVTTSSEVATLAGAFVVASSQASFGSVSPASCSQGQSLPVTLTGVGTHFVQGVTIANFGDSVVASIPAVSSNLSATVQVACNVLAPVGPRTVTVVTGGEFALGTSVFTVTSSSASIASVSTTPVTTPPSALQGASATVTLNGTGTHWIEGGTGVSFGPGINVGTITVINSLQLTANISVSPTAAPGPVSVIATTNGEVAGLNNAFTVTAATPYISALSPDIGTQGTTLNVTASASLFTFLGTATANFGPNITVNGSGTLGSGGATIAYSITIAPVAFTGARTVAIMNGSSEYSFPFTVAPSAAALTGVAPSSGYQGGSYALQVVGTGTHWVQGTTTASLASGIAINRIVVNPASSTQAEVDITIPAGQPLGWGGLTMATGGEAVTLNPAFDVLPATPSCTVAPSSGMIGSSVPVEFICQYSHLGTGTQVTIDGNGVTPQKLAVLNPGTATATLTIAASAPAAPAAPCLPGNRNITLTSPLASGSEIITFPFCVTSTPAVLTSIVPYSAQPGTTLSVTITGQYSHFNACPTGPSDTTDTQVGFGPNTTWTCTSVNAAGQTITGQLAIAAAAAVGWRQAYVNTGAEQLSIGFLVSDPSATPAISPTLVSVSPASGAQGQTLTVTITGSGTNFACIHSPCDPPGTNAGDTVASLGQGVTVNSLTIVNPTTATAVLQVSPTTPAGLRGVTMTTGAAVVAAPLFAVTPGIAAISAIRTNPATTPPSVAQFAVVNFEITGMATHWLQGETTLNFGAGITVNQFTVNSATDITGQMTVLSTAAIGFRSISATTGGELAASSSEALLVTPAVPALLNITPATGQQGTVVTVQMNGQATHWGAGTTASFNATGITATVNATSATQATLTVTILGTTYITVPPSLYTLTVTTNLGGGNIEQVSLPSIFAVTPGDALVTSVTPNQGAQGSTLPVAIVGQNTNFANGITTAAFSTGGCSPPSAAGVNVAGVQVADSHHATLSLAIGPAASTGLLTLCLTTLGENVAYANAFTVEQGTPTLNGVAPVSGQQGQTVPVTIIGQFTHWTQNAANPLNNTMATFGQGITVNNLTIVSNTSATATLEIDPLAFTGSRTVTFTTGGEVVQGNLFSVVAGPATVSSINPISANQGTQDLYLAITGENTHWSAGLTQFSISGGGADITVNGFQVIGPTSVLANLSLSPTATLGARSIFLSTGGENVSDSAAFVVTGGIPSILQVSPYSVLQGSNAVNIVVTGGFTQWSCGTAPALPCQLSASTNTQAMFSGGGDLTITGASTINSNTSITLVVNVSATAATGLHTLTVQTGGQTLTANINVAAIPNTTTNPPSIAYENPGLALVGQTLSVQFTGQSTQWAQGLTSATFGAGITLNNFQVLNATSAVANITIAANASVGARTVTFTTGSTETESTTFSVTTGTPSLVFIDPGSVIQGQTLNLDLVGQYTTFNAATTQFTSAPGITVNSSSVLSATAARVNISASAEATLGSTPLTVTTGSQVVSNNFSVTPSQAVITSIAPNTALQGTSVNATLTGFLTHWTTSTIFSFGAGITPSNISVNSTLQTATMTLTVAALAPIGASAATATTAGEVAVLNNAFVVQPGTPILLSSIPSSAQQGTNFSLGILGQYTSFGPGTTVNLGPGVSNIVVTPTSPTSLTVTGTVNPLAFTGTSNIVVTTGTQVLTLYSAFSIAQGPAAITLVNPAQANQGQTLNVVVTGANTHFAQNATTASFGPGITVNTLTVNGLLSATANITVANFATPELNTVTLSTPGETASAVAAFRIVASSPVINFITPASAAQGSNPSILVSTTFTHFVQGNTTAAFSPADVTATVTVTSSGATLAVSVSPTAVLGPHTLTIATPQNSETVTLTNALTVTAGPASIVSATATTPATIHQNDIGDTIVITGGSTHFSAASVVAFCTGVTPVQTTLNSLTQLTVAVNVSAAAPVGGCGATVTTGGEVASGANLFSVLAGFPVLTSVNPASARLNTTVNVAVSGMYTHFAAPGAVAYDLTTAEDANSANSNPDGVWSFLGGTTLLPYRSSGFCNPSVSGLTSDYSSNNGCSAAFFVATGTGHGSPADFLAGDVIVYSADGTPGSSPASVNWTAPAAGTVTIAGKIWYADSYVQRSNNYILALNTTTLATGSVAYNDGSSRANPSTFNGGGTLQVSAGDVVSFEILDESGSGSFDGIDLSIVETPSVSPTATTASFGAGITVNSLTVTNSTAATANISVQPTATLGARTVTMTTGAETATLANAFTVNPALLSIAAAGLPGSITGVNYSQIIGVTGGLLPYNFTVSSGSLPPPLTLGLTTGLISGAPAAAGTSNFTILVTDQSGQSASMSYTVKVYNPLSITTASLPNATTGVNYSQTIGVTGGLAPYNFTITSGSLPSPLTLGPNTGLISGAPTAAGTSNPTIQVTDQSGQSASMAYTVNVYNPLTLTPASLPAGVSGVAYSQTVTAAGGAAPLTLSLHSGSLPTGVMFTAATGVIGGMPTSTGPYNIDIRVTDNNGNFTDQAYSFTIYGPLVFTTTALAPGRRTFSYTQTINTTGGDPTVTLSLASGPLPTGILLGGNALTGTPTQAGTFPITIKMTDALGNFATESYSLVIADLLTISSTTLPNGTVGVAYSQSVPTANGVGQVNFAVTAGALPTSLTLNPGTGLISGVPSAAGPFTFTVQATDTLPITVTQQFTLTIAPPPLITNISPGVLAVSQTGTIALIGQNTNWDNTTTANFGAGVTVNSVAISGNTSASVNVTVQAGAAAGTRAVTLTTPDANSEIANLAVGQTFTIVAAPPTLSSLAPYGARKNTTASVAVTGQNLLGATFQFANPIPNLANVPGPISIVSNDGSNVVLSFSTGAAEGQYALSAVTSLGSSPAIQFIVEPSGPQTAEALAASVLNIDNPNWITSAALPAGKNSYEALPASVLNIDNPNWITSTALPAGKNSYEALPASVLNIDNPNWVTSTALPAGQNSYEALPASVLNIDNPNWVTVATLPAGKNSYEALPVSVLDLLWNSANNYVPPAGRNFSMALPVAVCAPPQCTSNQTEVIALHPPISAMASSAVATPALAPAVAQPHLEPVEELDAVVEGRTLHLSAESLVSADLAIVSYEVNGVIVGRTIRAPHQFLFTVPAGISDLAFRALVELPTGEGQASQLAHVPVVPDTGAAVQLPELRKGETATLYGSGLKAEFFAFAQSLAAPPPLAGLAPQSTGYVTAVNQPNPASVFGNDPLGAAISHDFAARYSGEVWAESEGAYQFWVTATSGAALRIDGSSVTQPVNLTRGWHKIELEYFLVAGAESVVLEWQQPGAASQVLGPDSLRTPLTGVPLSDVPLKFDSVWFEIQQEGQPARYVMARQDQ